MSPSPNGLIDLKEQHLVWAVLQKLKRLYDGFGFLFDDVLRSDRNDWQYIFVGELPRARLGLDPRLKPGDIDVLIVPYRDDQMRVDLAAAVEIKRLTLRGGRIGKNVDTYGITQAEGLLRDGFPLVGVLHIIVSDRGPSENIWPVEVWRCVDANEQVFEKVREGTADLTAHFAADLQISRLMSRAASPEIGFNTLAFSRADSVTRLLCLPLPMDGQHNSIRI